MCARYASALLGCSPDRSSDCDDTDTRAAAGQPHRTNSNGERASDRSEPGRVPGRAPRGPSPPSHRRRRRRRHRHRASSSPPTTSAGQGCRLSVCHRPRSRPSSVTASWAGVPAKTTGVIKRDLEARNQSSASGMAGWQISRPVRQCARHDYIIACSTGGVSVTRMVTDRSIDLHASWSWSAFPYQ